MFYAEGETDLCAEVAQSVEQRTENPCVAGSIPALGKLLKRGIHQASARFRTLDHAECFWRFEGFKRQRKQEF